MWSVSLKLGNDWFLAISMQKLWRYLVRLIRWTKLSWSNHLNWALWRPWSSLQCTSCRKGRGCKNRGRKNCKRISNTRSERIRGTWSIIVVRKRTINGLTSCIKEDWRTGPNDSCSCWRGRRRCYFDHYHHRHTIQKERPVIELETKAKGGKVCKWA